MGGSKQRGTDGKIASGFGDLLAPDPEAAVPAWARAIGVTRVARVTGLDRCGVEVACAIRPAGDILQVSNGKGETFATAKASALSEALELWACEQVEPSQVHWLREAPDERFWPPEFLGGFEGLPRTRGTVQPWALGDRLDRPGQVYVPASHVWCPTAAGAAIGLRTTSWTANGLGAHRDPDRATWHGLLEMLEREAICRVFPEGWMPEHLATRGLKLDHPRATALEALGMHVHCVDATPARWPIPVVAVLIVDPDSRAPRLAAGYACRFTGADAAEAALYEACQSRLTEIHGAREDVEQEALEVPDWVLDVRPPRRDAAKLKAWKGSRPALLHALGVAAAAVDVTPIGSPVAVSRVFVPGYRISELLV